MNTLTSEVTAAEEISIIQPPAEDMEINNVALLRFLANEVSRRENGGNKSPQNFPYAKKARTDVFLSKRTAKNTPLTSVDDLAFFFNSIEEIVPVKYAGKHDDKVFCLKLRIPAEYSARVGEMRYCDLPKRAKDAQNPWVGKADVKHGAHYKPRLICSKICPIWVDQGLFEISAEKITQTYGWVTIKVWKETLSLYSWDVGLVYGTTAMSSDEEMVILGQSGWQQEEKPAVIHSQKQEKAKAVVRLSDLL
jgi:hypothetical protein